MPHRPPRSQRRTTLWQLIACALMVAVLSLFLRGFLFSRTSSGRGDPVQSNIAMTVTAIQLYRADTGSFPPSLGTLVSGTPKYLVQMPLDGWGRPLLYTQDPDGGVTVLSLGADGVAGGTDAAADISKHLVGPGQ